MGPYGLIIAGVLWAASVVGGILWGIATGDDRATARQAREDSIEQRASAAAAAAAASAISTIKVQHRTVQQEVQREISERVVYRECVHSAEQLQRINAAITGRAEPADRGIVPAANAAGGSKLRGDDGQAR